MKRVVIRDGIHRGGPGYSIWFVMHERDHSFVVKPLTVEIDRVGEAFRLPEPALLVQKEELLAWVKAFMGGLEEAGILEKIKEDQGVLKATREHLEDLRKMSQQMLEKLTRHGA